MAYFPLSKLAGISFDRRDQALPTTLAQGAQKSKWKGVQCDGEKQSRIFKASYAPSFGFEVQKFGPERIVVEEKETTRSSMKDHSTI
ncbi:hypothetical protein Dda_6301 [Drechslerella dactyloides]|uniref:Uncharacterized protein n=1 Tax=Drechslerella dactyloides TaxID=74499 RepID=A0AAD6IVC2_DREDA|nr:hypothetical protein Dda_6301 [Drechslerella dactyloides]